MHWTEQPEHLLKKIPWTFIGSSVARLILALISLAVAKEGFDALTRSEFFTDINNALMITIILPTPIITDLALGIMPYALAFAWMCIMGVIIYAFLDITFVALPFWLEKKGWLEFVFAFLSLSIPVLIFLSETNAQSIIDTALTAAIIVPYALWLGLVCKKIRPLLFQGVCILSLIFFVLSSTGVLASPLHTPYSSLEATTDQNSHIVQIGKFSLPKPKLPAKSSPSKTPSPTPKNNAAGSQPSALDIKPKPVKSVGAYLKATPRRLLRSARGIKTSSTRAMKKIIAKAANFKKSTYAFKEKAKSKLSKIIHKKKPLRPSRKNNQNIETVIQKNNVPSNTPLTRAGGTNELKKSYTTDLPAKDKKELGKAIHNNEQKLATARKQKQTKLGNVGDKNAGRLNTARVRPIQGRLPINSQKYAGKTIPLRNLPKGIRNKYPHSVAFDGAGYPDFSRYSIKNVRIKPAETRAVDFAKADKIAGYNRTNPRPNDYTWHHHQDYGYMQLVPSDLHNAIRHTGGVAKGKQ